MSAGLDAAPSVPAAWLTPRLCRSAPLHRWFVFPHSYAPELVRWLTDRLELEAGARVLDPFCGAGTTLVECRSLGLRPTGMDLLPLAVLAARTKTNPPTRLTLRKARSMTTHTLRGARPTPPPGPLLGRAFDETRYGVLATALATASRSPAGGCVLLATLAVARRSSRLVADGGWLRAAQPELSADDIPAAIDVALAQMEEDTLEDGIEVPVYCGDARSLAFEPHSFEAVVTSPPYPNRHDYTRVFAVELELAFGLGEAVKQLRYQALSSHPEARPSSRTPNVILVELEKQVALVASQHRDGRIARMLAGYFRDLASVLRALHRVLVPGGRAAFVVGNAQYCGVAIPVDEHLARIGELNGYEVDGIELLRLRGNSAQQMAAYGRKPSRESVVVLRRSD